MVSLLERVLLINLIAGSLSKKRHIAAMPLKTKMIFIIKSATPETLLAPDSTGGKLRVNRHPWRRLETAGSKRINLLVGMSLWAAKQAY
tara:strand:- start:305 stop:571 length:267 start_codon:yes stop_codon:yes gene_type:complete